MDNLIRKIVEESIESSLPDKAVTRELKPTGG